MKLEIRLNDPRGEKKKMLGAQGKKKINKQK